MKLDSLLKYCIILVCFGAFFVGGNFVYAQEEAENELEEDTAVDDEGAAATASGSTNSFWRWGFYEWTTQRFQGEHPFYEMSGNRFFEEGRTSLNSTQDNTGIFLPDEKYHEHKSGAVTKILHGLPPMSIEYIMPTGWDLLTAHSVNLYYTNTWLTDQTAQVGAKKTSQVPLIEMRNHMYFFSYSIYGLFPPGRNQTEIFYGIGGAFVETTIRNGIRSHGTNAPHTRASVDVLDHYRSDGLVFFQRVGMTTSADNFGLSFELYMLGKTPVMGNPFRDGEIKRLAPDPVRPLEKEIDLQGILLRLAWGVYSFWD